MMRIALTLLAGFAVFGFVPSLAVEKEPSLDSRVAKIKLPVDDVELNYCEANPHMMVEIVAGNTSIQGVRFFIGDGKVAVPLEADSLHGIKFQATKMLKHGHKFAKYSVVALEDGYLTISDLKPGDVYVVMPAVNFVPKNKS